MKAIEIAENIFELTITLPNSKVTRKKIVLLTEEQKALNEIFDFGC